jgi:ATP-dependent HslUV protease subunit HslV
MRSLFHNTTILAVRHRGGCAIAGDGQVTLGQTVVKHGARKIRRLRDGQVLAGFAGASADAMALFVKFEAKIEEHRGAPTASCADSRRTSWPPTASPRSSSRGRGT